MKKKLILISLFISAFIFSQAQTTPQTFAFGDNWVCTDGAGRILPDFSITGKSKNDKYVGMYYTLTHGYFQHNKGITKSRSVMEVLEKDHINLEWNALDPSKTVVNYFMTEPEDGYINSSDSWYERKQLIMLGNAGVDFIFIDLTNDIVPWEALEITMREICDLQKIGFPSPKLVMWTQKHDNALNLDKQQITDLYTNIYKAGKYKDAWFFYQGKPLFLGPSDVITDSEILNYFNWRYMWADQDGNGKWNFMTGYPQKQGKDFSGGFEQLVLMKAYGGAFRPKGEGRTPPIGSSGRWADKYMPTLNDLWYSPTETGKGEFLKEQFKRLTELEAQGQSPRFLTFSQWNEYGAGAWRCTSGDANTYYFYGRNLNPATDRWMIDGFNIEFNRDMGPIKGYFTDNYYYQVCDYIRRFKGMQPPQAVSPASTIKIDGSFDEWYSLSPLFRDVLGDIKQRDYVCDETLLRYVNKTGRNDIIESRVARDASNLYFYAKTADKLTNYFDPNWMLLYIDADRNSSTGWNGYDYVINMGVTNINNTTIKQYSNGTWKQIGTASYALNGNEIEISVAKNLLGLNNANPQFYFKWIDNQQKLNDIIDVLSNGDAAPDRRFSYYYNSLQNNTITQRPNKTLTIPGVIEAEDFDMGGNMVAYYDADASNNGNQYRTSEGVDIEVCSTGGYDIGWTNNDEWTEYTVNIASAGTYTVDVNISSPTGNGIFHLELDGVNITGNLNIPNTGGTQNWQNVSAKVQLAEGTHLLRLYIDQSSGANFNKMTFTKSTGLMYGNGDGLLAEYFDQGNFQSLILTRVDNVVLLANSWNGTVPGQGDEDWTVRWTGQVQALTTETYTFYATYDDQCRLWVNNTLLIDDWSGGAAREKSGTIALEAGKRYDIKIEFGEGFAYSQMRLDWSTATISKALVPQTQLYSTILPALGTPANLVAFANSDGTVKLEWTDNSSQETKFIIERKDGTGSFVQVGTVDYNINSFMDITVSNSTAAVWRVKAINAGNSSGYSNEARICMANPISITPIDTVHSNSAPFPVTAISDLGLPLTLSIVSGTATINGTLVTLTGFTGNVTIKAYNAGNINTCQGEAYETFTIKHICSPQTISGFTKIPNRSAEDLTPITLSAVNSSGQPVIYSIVSGNATISGNTLSIDGTQDTITVKAYNPGSNAYCPSNELMQSFIVTIPSSTTCNGSDGYSTYEIWKNIQGTEISTIPLTIKADSMAKVYKLEVLQSTPNRDYYGVRVKGYLCVPYTGDYIFYTCGDDQVEFWLSTSLTNPKDNKQKIAYNYIYTPLYSWNNTASQKSSPVQLKAGEKYYFEVLMKEGPGGDYFAIRWQGPFGLDEVIPGKYLNAGCSAQSITMPGLTSIPANDSVITLNAASTSGLPVTYKVSSGPAYVVGNVLHLKASTGRFTLICSQSGDDTFCPAPDVVKAIMITPAGIEEYELSKLIDIYPNPAKEQLYVNSHKLSVKEIRISDLQGRIVRSFSVSHSPFDFLDISGLTDGMYFITLSTEQHLITKKFIINR